MYTHIHGTARHGTAKQSKQTAKQTDGKANRRQSKQAVRQ